MGVVRASLTDHTHSCRFRSFDVLKSNSWGRRRRADIVHQGEVGRHSRIIGAAVEGVEVRSEG